ncbi:hypothetical protein FS749_011539 [Ceratobasidium sp. UAMH 11750]|nr:hypothetical protein FS749_011539 [Ceratobasidium sp. UAMH 11750]
MPSGVRLVSPPQNVSHPVSTPTSVRSGLFPLGLHLLSGIVQKIVREIGTSSLRRVNRCIQPSLSPPFHVDVHSISIDRNASPLSYSRTRDFGAYVNARNHVFHSLADSPHHRSPARPQALGSMSTRSQPERLTRSRLRSQTASTDGRSPAPGASAGRQPSPDQASPSKSARPTKRSATQPGGPPRKKSKASGRTSGNTRNEPPADDEEADPPGAPEPVETRDSTASQAKETDLALEQAVSFMEREVVAGTLPPSDDSRRIASQIQAARLGGVYLTGYGVGHVDGLVNLEQNPNNRVNPRHLDPHHVQKLVQVFMDPSTMRDWETPIVIMIPRSKIEPGCLEKILTCKSRSPGANVPALSLLHAQNAEIASLEFASEYYQRGNSWLSEEQLPPLRQQLHELRSSRPKATLINGNH